MNEPAVELSLSQARNIALASQGFSRKRPTHTRQRHISEVAARLGLFQIDSVNVVERAHYMPLFSRLGAYDRALLDRAFMATPRTLTEYWAHEASLVDLALWPALRFRMESRQGMWSMTAQIAQTRPELLDHVVSEVIERGALTATQIHDGAPRRRDHWGWNRSDAKHAMEYQFHAGKLCVTGRTPSFERVYDIPERVIPPEVRNADRMSPDDACRILIDHAGRAHGVGTAACLADYFRLPAADARRAIRALVDEGRLIPARVRRWDRPAFVHCDAPRDPRPSPRALLSPFDPLVFERTRTEKLFGFRYRIEIYVPAQRRQYGYYVLPFLLGNRLVARVDLKADRAAQVLRVNGAWAEPHAGSSTSAELAGELAELSSWLGLRHITVAHNGDLAASLDGAVN